MIVKATPHWEQRDAVSYAFYFLWEGEHWTLLKRVPIDPRSSAFIRGQ
jgi:hypothetical protein